MSADVRRPTWQERVVALEADLASERRNCATYHVDESVHDAEVGRLRSERDRLLDRYLARCDEARKRAIVERDQASADGWAEGEQWVMDHLWEYAALRTRLGRFLWRLRSRWRCRNPPLPTEIIEEERLDGPKRAPTPSRTKEPPMTVTTITIQPESDPLRTTWFSARELAGTGLLWAINRIVFHPRGFALSVDVDTDELSLYGDGTEPWAFETSLDDEGFTEFEATMSRLRDEFACRPEEPA